LTKALLFQKKGQILTETNCESKDEVSDRLFARFPTASIVENYRYFDEYDYDFGGSGFSDYGNSPVSGSDNDSDNV